jgi:hypothetical protein
MGGKLGIRKCLLKQTSRKYTMKTVGIRKDGVDENVQKTVCRNS